MLKMKLSQRRTWRQKAVTMVTHTTGCSGPTPAVLTGYQSISWLRRKKNQQCESGVRDFFPFTSCTWIMHKSKVQACHGVKSFLKTRQHQPQNTGLTGVKPYDLLGHSHTHTHRCGFSLFWECQFCFVFPFLSFFGGKLSPGLFPVLISAEPVAGRTGTRCGRCCL